MYFSRFPIAAHHHFHHLASPAVRWAAIMSSFDWFSFSFATRGEDFSDLFVPLFHSMRLQQYDH
jgi:hypothetical protein